MFKAKTLEDFPTLSSLIEELNKMEIWNLDLQIKQDYSECDLYVIDNHEELYYGGCLFEKTMEQLEEALRKDTGDNGAFFDCVCPGRYIADFEGRSRFDKGMFSLHIHLAAYEGLVKYMNDNGLKPQWTKITKEDLDQQIEELTNSLLKVFEE